MGLGFKGMIAVAGRYNAVRNALGKHGHSLVVGPSRDGGNCWCSVASLQ
jgi:hypothetical protein